MNNVSGEVVLYFGNKLTQSYNGLIYQQFISFSSLESIGLFPRELSSKQWPRDPGYFHFYAPSQDKTARSLLQEKKGLDLHTWIFYCLRQEMTQVTSILARIS